MPVLGAPNSSVYPARGVWIPPASLNIWKAARANHATQLVEVIHFGDSTLWGQTEASVNYPMTNKIRALLIAGGYTSAGRGFIHGGLMDDADLAGPLDPIGFTAKTGFALSDSWGVGYSFKSNVNGDTVTLRGKGTICRLFHQPMNVGGNWTYSINGATAVPVTNVPPSGYIYKGAFIYLTGLPGAGAVNTITVVNSGAGRIGVIADFFNATGIVIHNQGVQGGQSGWFGPAAADNSVDPSLLLGLVPATVAPPSEQQHKDLTVGARSPKLAIFQYGVNDVQGAASADPTPLANNTALFIRMARNAGADPVIVIPNFERLTNGRTYAGAFRSSLTSVARSYNVATIDSNEILGPISTWGTAYPGASDSGTNPHLNQAMYDAVASAIYNYIYNAP